MLGSGNWPTRAGFLCDFAMRGPHTFVKIRLFIVCAPVCMCVCVPVVCVHLCVSVCAG